MFFFILTYISKQDVCFGLGKAVHVIMTICGVLDIFVAIGAIIICFHGICCSSAESLVSYNKESAQLT